ncbi:MAG: glyoxalase/bleomycin resistance/extradiol dioxygenase family protein [Roseivirga sp.]|nr:glyoxalase/bleomycin resistance/extradiol dioxygenase family protein [Roseivirga sp.]
MKLNLIVIRTENPEVLKSQYELLGLRFDYHRHENGPYHYAAESEGLVFEIYPLSKSMKKADGSLRLGFDIDNLEKVIAVVRSSNWLISTEVRETPWGRVAVIQDMDGRKVELRSV